MPRHLRRAVAVEDLRAHARRRLPRAIFDFIDGGAEDEVTLRANRAAFEAVRLRPRVLVDVAARDQSVTVCGQALSTPVLLAPVGLPRLAHPDGEIGAARAAHRAGTTLAVSSASSASLEDVARQAPGPLWFQLYPWRDRDVTGGLIERARSAGYRTLCVTVDTPAVGGRERDVRSGFTIPPRVTLRSLGDAVRHPRWFARQVGQPLITLANLAGMPDAPGRSPVALAAYANQKLLNPANDWDELAWMREQWDGPFLVKGIMTREDARIAADHGADGIVVSNHGGRQLDGIPATLEVLREVVDAVGDRVDVLIDGGFRRGIDVVKALALGAGACLIGRPYLWGLAAGGERGVDRVLQMLTTEIDRALALMGCPSVRALDRSAVSSRLDTGDRGLSKEEDPYATGERVGPARPSVGDP